MYPHFGVDADSGFATSKRNIDAGALVRHEGRQRLDLVRVDVRRVPDAALARSPVVRVLGAVAGDHLEAAVILLEGEIDLQDVSARLDDLQNAVELKTHSSLMIGCIQDQKF